MPSVQHSVFSTKRSSVAAPGLVTGQAALSMMLLIGTVILVAGVLIVLLVLGLVTSGYGFRAGIQASAVASAGARDAMLQFTRNKGFSPGTYTVPLGAQNAIVTVSYPTPGKVTIVSEATVSSYKRNVRVILSVDPITGQVDLLSWQTI